MLVTGDIRVIPQGKVKELSLCQVWQKGNLVVGADKDAQVYLLARCVDKQSAYGRVRRIAESTKKNRVYRLH